MMGSPTAELARKLMNKEANKLAKELQNHKPEDVEVLVKAATSFLEGPYHRTDEQYIALQSALAKFAPKPAKVYVLPEWKTFYEAQEMRYSSHWDGDYVTVDINARDKNKNPISVNEDRYNVIRELTAIDAPEPAQKWNMPTLQQINEICGQPYGTAPTHALDTWYQTIRNKIMAMNDEQ